MGNWTIVIHGTGPHHNQGVQPYDADKIAQSTVQTLLQGGHQVTSCSFTHGGREEYPIPKSDSQPS